MFMRYVLTFSGALLDEDEQVASGALMDTLVARINADHKILPRFRLHVVRVKVTNSFAAAKASKLHYVK